jgi:filamentous hemagglutinin
MVDKAGGAANLTDGQRAAIVGASTLLGGLAAGALGQSAQGGAMAAQNEALNNGTEDHRTEEQKAQDELRAQLSKERAVLDNGGTVVIGYDQDGNPITAIKAPAPMLGGGTNNVKSGVPGDDFTPNPNITAPYSRPSGAGPTAEQRAAVQGQPCVDCGAITSNQVADHIDPLVVQYYRDGAVNVQDQRSVDAVQPHCPTCSAIQGGQLGAFGKWMRQFFGF